MEKSKKKKTKFHEYDSEESKSSASSNYSDQIRKFNDFDILITIHGSHMTNGNNRDIINFRYNY